MRALFLLLAIAGVYSCGSGPASSDSGTDAASVDAASPSPASRQSEFFDSAVVQDIELEIDPVDLDKMIAALPTLISVPATFRWRDTVLTQVGVRYKGNSSSSPNQRFKRSFFVDFDAIVPRQKFEGLRSVALDNGVQFGSLFSERLITDVLREIGVPASRANYARLDLNGQYIGLYVNVERINKSFLKLNFASDEGNLYKCDEGGPGANLAYQGDDPTAYEAFEAKTNELSADGSDLVAFIRALDMTADADVAEMLATNFEVDAFLRMTAVFVLAGAFDQYTGFQAHNYYLYRDPTTLRFSYLPWDLDVGFADNAFGHVPVIDGWNAAYPLPVVPRPLLERMLQQSALLETYRRYAADYLERHFEPELLGARLDALYAQARPHLIDDPFPHVRATNTEDTSYDDIVASLKAFMQRRYDRAKAELENPSITPPIMESRDVDPMPGEASPEDPSELRVIAMAASGIELAWTDNASDDIASIVQKCAGAGCANFVNAIGLPGSDITMANDTGVTEGATLRYRVYAMRPGPAGSPIGTGPSNVVTAIVP